MRTHFLAACRPTGTCCSFLRDWAIFVRCRHGRHEDPELMAREKLSCRYDTVAALADDAPLAGPLTRGELISEALLWGLVSCPATGLSAPRLEVPMPRSH